MCSRALVLPERLQWPDRQVLAARGSLQVVVSARAEDVVAAQKLRYDVFYDELNASPDEQTRAARRDFDEFDAACDHFLVLDDTRPGHILGTYRALSQPAASRLGGFYSANEFDLAPLLRRHRALRFLELGRACVLASYRTRPVLELLWQGIWNYVRLNAVDVLFGCVSLSGTDPQCHRESLCYLARNFIAPDDWRVSALPGRSVSLSCRSCRACEPRKGARSLPPLLKGYLRLGSYIGEGAVVDHQFNSTDVFVILPVASIKSRYFSRFGAPAHPLSC
jgi:L-ornithine Nalpha-acyltransferase